MALKTLAEQLQQQNKTLVDIKSGISDLASAISIRNDFDRLQQLEDDRESQRQQSESVSQRSYGGGSSDSGSIFPFGLGLGLGTGGLGSFMMSMGKKIGITGLGLALAKPVGDFVEGATGSVDLGDATTRALSWGALGSLFGKKIGLISGVMGAMFNDENMAKLDELGTTISNSAEQIAKNINITLPSVNELYQRLAQNTGSLLDFTNGLLTGDVDQMGDSAYLAGLGVTALTSGKNLTQTKLNMAADKLAPPPPPPSNAERLQINAKTASNLSDKQLQKLLDKGFKVNSAGGLYNAANGQMVSLDKADELLKAVGASPSTKLATAMAKFTKFAKLVKLPIVGPAISAMGIGNTLLDDQMSKRDKQIMIAQQLGGIGGSVLGGVIGALGGSMFPGVGTLAGGILGSITGAMSGEALANNLAQWLLGDVPDMTSVVRQRTQPGDIPGVDSIPGYTVSIPPKAGSFGVMLSDAKQTNDKVKLAQQYAFGGGGTNVVSNNVTNVSGGSGGGSSMPVEDPFDPVSR